MDRLTPSDMAWFLATYQGTAADIPHDAIRHLADHGFVAGDDEAPVITAAGLAWLARNGLTGSPPNRSA